MNRILTLALAGILFAGIGTTGIVNAQAPFVAQPGAQPGMAQRGPQGFGAAQPGPGPQGFGAAQPGPGPQGFGFGAAQPGPGPQGFGLGAAQPGPQGFGFG
ncbi:MAG: hypothetical protein J6Y92_02605, partial [Lentisphaeria bacterium]|nr:hypothetical protein [Lentisphaeria bacterium]